VPLLNLVLLVSFLVAKTLLVVLLTSKCAEAWGVVLMPVWEKVLTVIKKAEKL